MNNRAFTISLCVALLAVMMIYSYVSSTEESLKNQYGTEVSVVVATQDIRELDPIDESNVKVTAVPRKFKQEGAGGKIEDFAGGLALAPIKAGQQVTRTVVTYPGARTGLSRQVSPGKRAVSIKIDDRNAVSKLIKPGDRVDVLTKFDLGSGKKEKVEVRTILQDVLVLATGRYVTNTLPGILEIDPSRPDVKTKKNLAEYTSYANITLEVDPNQAQMIVFAESTLEGVYLVLRNTDDNAKEVMEQMTMCDLLGVDKSKCSGAAAAAPRAPASLGSPGNPGPPAGK
jgi:pilus assembly protein CpaB